MKFPAGFLFGTATAATQIEGGCTTSDWYTFAKRPGAIKNGDSPAVACDSWSRWHEDIELQRKLGMSAYRMGIEWARIEPRPGHFDRTALQQYRRMLCALRDAGIEPMVTLLHFTLPRWLEGGILAPDFPERLAIFARQALTVLGDVCSTWITINEPTVMVSQGYITGVWPPGKKNPALAYLAHGQLLDAHDAVYRAMKDKRPELRVGIAHHLRPVIPARPDSRMDRMGAAVRQHLGDAFALTVCKRQTQDFFGINYYSRDVVRVASKIPVVSPVSDLGWEVYPEGLGQLVRRWWLHCKLPIYITENGIADADDSRRATFITEHLTQLAKTIEEGIDVRGYYHWSLLDNFEWAEGYEPRFGLVEVDYATGKRRIRESAWVYAEIARGRGT